MQDFNIKKNPARASLKSKSVSVRQTGSYGFSAINMREVSDAGA